MLVTSAVATFAACVSVIGGPTPVALGASPVVTSIDPVRVFDSRPGNPTFDGKGQTGQRVRAGTVASVQVAGRGIPNDAMSVVLNVTAVRPSAAGYLTVFPCGIPTPNASNINYRPGDVIPGVALAKIGVDGRVCIFTSADTDLVVDMGSYVPNGGTPTAIDPVRAMDTRIGAPTIDQQYAGAGIVAAGTTRRVRLTGRSIIPDGSSAVVINVTSARSIGDGFVTVFPCSQPAPTTASLNFEAGVITPNTAVVGITSVGEICLFVSQTTELIVDVYGYVPAGGAPTMVTAARLYDSRPGFSTVDNKFAGTNVTVGQQEAVIQVNGRAGIPANAATAILNIAAVRPIADGYLTVYPCGAKRPDVSNVNYRAGSVSSNSVVVKVGDRGTVCVFTSATSNIVSDVTGYVDGAGTTTDPTSTGAPSTTGGSGTTSGNGTTSTSGASSTSPTGTGGTTSSTSGSSSSSSSSSSTTGSTNASTSSTSPTSGGCRVAGTLVTTIANAAECSALVDLFQSTKGASWTNKRGWNTATDPCGWYGITCLGGSLTSLKLPGNGLSGGLPPSIANLTKLQNLVLSGNSLSGVLPPTIGSMPSLIELDLTGNVLSGPIPASIAGPRMTTLSLSRNRLTGSIPVELGSAPRLNYLYLNGNELTGTIPAALASLSSAYYIYLNSNNLSGSIPVQLGTMQSLARLDLHDNQLSGSIPTSLATAPRLVELNVSSNRLNGSIPDNMLSGRYLQVFLAENNQLSGSLPTKIPSTSKLKYFEVSTNRLTGTIPAAFGNASDLRTLVVSYNRLTGGLPPELSNPENLDTLFVDNNLLNSDLYSAFFAFLSKQRTLTFLRLTGNTCLRTTNAQIINFIRARDTQFKSTPGACN